MKLNKNSGQHNIDFLGLVDKIAAAKVDKVAEQTAEQKFQQTVQEQAAKKIDQQNPAHMGRSTILSAGRSELADNSGTPHTSATNHNKRTLNSIFDPNIIEEAAKRPSNDEVFKEIREKENERRASIEDALLKETFKNYEDIDTRNGSSISSISAHKAHNSSPLNSGLSILGGDMDFGHVPEKTAGEKMSEEKNAKRIAKEANEDWKAGGRVVKSSDVLDSFFDNIMKGKDGK